MLQLLSCLIPERRNFISANTSSPDTSRTSSTTPAAPQIEGSAKSQEACVNALIKPKNNPVGLAEAGYSLAVEFPCIVTLLTLEGRVLFQNPLSLAHHGDHRPAARAGNESAHGHYSSFLRRLFAFESLELLASMMEDAVQKRVQWKRVIRVSAPDVLLQMPTTAFNSVFTNPYELSTQHSVGGKRDQTFLYDSKPITSFSEQVPDILRSGPLPLQSTTSHVRTSMTPPSSRTAVSVGWSDQQPDQQSQGSLSSGATTFQTASSMRVLSSPELSLTHNEVLLPKRVKSLFSVMPAALNTHISEEEEYPCWHEVTAKLVNDPVTGQLALLIVQNDVTQLVELRERLADLTEAQLSMLSQIFPKHILEHFTGMAHNTLPEMVPGHIGQLARLHQQVTILFLDIVGFTDMSKEVAPDAVMTFLNKLFSLFDEMLDEHAVHKVETAGDCYIVCGGLLTNEADGFVYLDEAVDVQDSALRVMALAKQMLRCSRQVLMPHNNEPVSVRIGIHTGDCVSGLVGLKMPKFSIFGDGVNTASRMESTSKPEFVVTNTGHIQASAAAYRLLQHSEQWQATGGVHVKGKGVMETYLWVPPSEDVDPERGSEPSASNRSNLQPATSSAFFVVMHSAAATMSSPSSSERASPRLHMSNSLKSTTEAFYRQRRSMEYLLSGRPSSCPKRSSSSSLQLPTRLSAMSHASSSPGPISPRVDEPAQASGADMAAAAGPAMASLPKAATRQRRASVCLGHLHDARSQMSTADDGERFNCRPPDGFSVLATLMGNIHQPPQLSSPFSRHSFRADMKNDTSLKRTDAARICQSTRRKSAWLG